MIYVIWTFFFKQRAQDDMLYPLTPWVKSAVCSSSTFVEITARDMTLSRSSLNEVIEALIFPYVYNQN